MQNLGPVRLMINIDPITLVLVIEGVGRGLTKKTSQFKMVNFFLGIGRIAILLDSFA